MTRERIYEFRDFVLSLFTMNKDSDLQNYFVKLQQMRIKYEHLLFNVDELLTRVKSHLSEKYGLVYRNKEWTVNTLKAKTFVVGYFEEVRRMLVDHLRKKAERVSPEKKDEYIRISNRKLKEKPMGRYFLDKPAEHLVEQVESDKVGNFEAVGLLDLCLMLGDEIRRNRMRDMLLKMERFRSDTEIPLFMKLSSAGVLKEIMKMEMPKDRDKIRGSEEFKIFRELTEKSILRTISFYHNRDRSPNQWRRYNPGDLNYKWTGSSDPTFINVLYEDEEAEDIVEEIPEPIEEEENKEALKSDLKFTIQGLGQVNDESGGGMKFSLKNLKQQSEENGFKIKLSVGGKPESNGLEKIANQDAEKETQNRVQQSSKDGKDLNSRPLFGNLTNLKLAFPNGYSTNEKQENHEKKIAEPLEKLKNEIKIEPKIEKKESEAGNQKIEEEEDEELVPKIIDFILPEDFEDMSKDFFKMVGRIEKLYLVKWKNVSYNQCTWESLSSLKEFQAALFQEENEKGRLSVKIDEFKKHNRALDKANRQKAILKKELHKRASESKRQGGSHRGYHRSYGLTEYRKTLYDVSRNHSKEVSLKSIKGLNDNFKGTRRLKSYQNSSVIWMIETWLRGDNFILADEMGLGKTVQSMAFLLYLKAFIGLSGPFLIVAPLGTLPHWKKTIEEWTSLNVVLYHDNESKKGRAMCREFEWYQKDIRLTGEFSSDSKICKFHVIITSFEVLIQDIDYFADHLCIQQIIIDEAHRLKNQNARVIKKFKQLLCKRIALLTGTPIQNNITELWSLLNFINPKNFADQFDFTQRFGDIKSEHQLIELKALLKPFMIRRMKNEVEKIPPLEESLIEIELTNFQKMSYKTLYEKNKGTLQKGAGLNYLTSMNNLEMQLRKCCNHPFLIREILDRVLEEGLTNEEYFRKMLAFSAKMIVLDKLLTKYRKENKKMLVFSQFTEMLKLIEEFLTHRNVLFRKIDGAVKARDRQNAIEAFNKNKNVFEVFLLSTKAGGLGINLTSANVVLIYDSDWNPQNDVQAIARAHRIGQTEEVKVYRLISKNTYESEMYRRASKKLGLDQAVLLTKEERKGNMQTETKEMISMKWLKEDKKDKADGKKMSKEEIEILLKKGFMGLLEDQNGEEQESMDIDELIRKSKRTKYSMINDKYTITKMNLTTEKREKRVDINDPNFWDKVLPDENTPAQVLANKLRELKDSDDFMNEETQVEFCAELNDRVYEYIDRAKKKEISYQEEQLFNKMMDEVIDDRFVSEQLKNICISLKSDLQKKPRRLKKRNVRSALRLKRSKSSKKRKSKNQTGMNQNGQEKKEIIQIEKDPNSDRKKKGKTILNKREVLEADNGVYGISESDEITEEIANPIKQKKRRKESKKTRNKDGSDPTVKKSKRVKTGSEKTGNGSVVNNNKPLCQICWCAEKSVSEPNAIMASNGAQVGVTQGKSDTTFAIKIATEKPSENDTFKFTLQNPEKKEKSKEGLKKCCGCKRHIHISCLEAEIQNKISRTDVKEHELADLQLFKSHLAKNRGSCFDHKSNMCINCQIGKMNCFVCKSLGNMKTKIEARTVEMVRASLRKKRVSETETTPFEELESDDVHRCKHCKRYFHLSCAARSYEFAGESDNIISKSNELICNAHRCQKCKTFSQSLLVSTESAKGVHKKCLSGIGIRKGPKNYQPIPQNHTLESFGTKTPNQPNQVQPQSKKPRKKYKKKELSFEEKKAMFAQVDITLVEGLSYADYTGDWCRFCGARYSEKFHNTLLGENTLCQKHFEAFETGDLKLGKMLNALEPIKPSANREIIELKRFLNRKKK